MMNFLCILSAIIAFISVISLIVGFLMSFYQDKRKLALQIILYSVIAFVIGFGTCFATFTLNL